VTAIGPPSDCPECDGTGTKITVRYSMFGDPPERDVEPCPRCSVEPPSDSPPTPRSLTSTPAGTPTGANLRGPATTIGAHGWHHPPHPTPPMSRMDNLLLAELRSYHAEVQAYRAEVDAQRAELRAVIDRLERKFEDHDRDIAAVHRRLFGDEDDT